MNLIEPLKNPNLWRSPSVLMLVAVNLIPLGGVLSFGWLHFAIKAFCSTPLNCISATDLLR